MKKGNPFALLPIVVFLVLFIAVGAYTHDFYSTMPAVVGFLIALVVAFAQNPKGKKVSFDEKLNAVARGAGDENIMIMCLVFVLAGAFSASVKAAGGVDSTVNFGLSILPGSVAVLGVFIVGCFISTSMGTSVGTVTALAPIAIGISEKTGIPKSMLQSGKEAYDSNSQQRVVFVQDTLVPYVTQWEQENTYKCLFSMQRKEGMYFKGNVSVLMRGDDKSRAEFYEKMIQNTVMNPDECRALEERDPIPGGLGKQFLATKNLGSLESILRGDATNG